VRWAEPEKSASFLLLWKSQIVKQHTSLGGRKHTHCHQARLRFSTSFSPKAPIGLNLQPMGINVNSTLEYRHICGFSFQVFMRLFGPQISFAASSKRLQDMKSRL
jgi:hypothetical protein